MRVKISELFTKAQLFWRFHLRRFGWLRGFLGGGFFSGLFLGGGHGKSSRSRVNRYHKKRGAGGVLARLDRLRVNPCACPRPVLVRRLRVGWGHLCYDYRPLARWRLSRGIYPGNQENGPGLHDGGTR